MLSSVGYTSRSEKDDDNLELEEEKKIIMKEIKKLNHYRQQREFEELER